MSRQDVPVTPTRPGSMVGCRAELGCEAFTVADAERDELSLGPPPCNF